MNKLDLLTLNDWPENRISKLITLANHMKQEPNYFPYRGLLRNKTMLLFFANSSLRTHISFDSAMTQLGGHAHYHTPEMSCIKTNATAGESLKDVAKVMSKYVQAIGIRAALGATESHGEGHKLLKEFAAWAEVPVISMGDDIFHPCQALAEIMGWSEWWQQGSKQYQGYKPLKGKKLLITWAKSNLPRPKCNSHSALLLASRIGMHVTVAHPSGYSLDESIIQQARIYAQQGGGSVTLTHDATEGYKDAHVVYVRHWLSESAYEGGKFQAQLEVSKALSHPDWITTSEKMRLTDNAIFANPMPVLRGFEATDEVVDGPRSIIYEVAENRLHVQKAILAMVMANAFVDSLEPINLMDAHPTN